MRMRDEVGIDDSSSEVGGVGFGGGVGEFEAGEGAGADGIFSRWVPLCWQILVDNGGDGGEVDSGIDGENRASLPFF